MIRLIWFEYWIIGLQNLLFGRECRTIKHLEKHNDMIESYWLDDFNQVTKTVLDLEISLSVR